MSEARACYTTARVRGGEVLWLDRHVERLARDAAALGLGVLEPELLGALFRDRAHEAFGDGDGALRVEARAADERLDLHVTPRGLGANPPTWRARRARSVHPGPNAVLGVKRADDGALESARAEVKGAEVDEVLIFDARGFLVEGSRSAVVLGLDGRAVTPPRARGGVTSLTRDAVLAACPEVVEADVHSADVDAADEIVCLNALRGARPVVELDGAAVGSGRPGPLAARLAAALPEL
jgi:D-alanine transaminase